MLVQQLDAYGTPLQQLIVPNQSAVNHDLTDHGATIPLQALRRTVEGFSAPPRRDVVD